MTMWRVCVCMSMVCATSAAMAVEPLPVPKPHEPRNKWEVSRFGDPADIKGDGYFIYTTDQGIARSPIHPFRPQIIPNTETTTGNLDICDDGRWISYTTREACWLIRPDGSGKTRVPIEPRPPHPRKRHRTYPAVFWHHSPLGDAIAFISGERQFHAIEVDLSGPTPRFGDTRKIVDLAGVQTKKMSFNQDTEQRFTVARNHVFLNVNGWAGSARHYMITIPDGGRGVATSERDVFDRQKTPKWECGSAMSHCGRIVAQNPGADIMDDYPNEAENGHKVLVVYPFFEADQPGLNVARDLYTDRALAMCWAPAQMRPKDVPADFHHWYFSNDPAYIIGTNQGQRGMKGDVADFEHIGIYLVHWPTGVYYRISDDKTRAHYMACHFYRDDRRVATSQVSEAPRATAGRKPEAAETAKTVVADVTAVEVSAVPDPDDLGVYKHVARFIRYKVNRVFSGELDGDHIVIGDWAVYDRNYQPAAKYDVGDRFIISAKMLTDDDEVTMARTIDDIEDVFADRYWAQGVKQMPARQ